MDGSKHERAAIIGLSYFIGFLTAFLAFSDKEEVINVYTQTAAVVDSEQVVELEEVKYDLYENELGLFLTFGDEQHLLSANRSHLTEGKEEVLGYHSQIIAAGLSPFSEFVYFCAQLTSDSEDCTAFVYDIANKTLNTVKQPTGEPFVAVASHKAFWQSDGSLVVNDFSSASFEQPWR